MIGAMMALAGGFVGGWFSLQSTDKSIRAQIANQEREAQRIRQDALLDTRKKVYEEYISSTNEDVQVIENLMVCMLSERSGGMRDTGAMLSACKYSSEKDSESAAKANAAGDRLFVYGSEDAIVKASALDVARLNMRSAVLTQANVGPTQLAYRDAEDDFLIAACVDVNPAAATACTR